MRGGAGIRWHRRDIARSAQKSGRSAGSFEDPQTGELLDNCQHVLLGCCTNLIDFYRRIGADSLIEFHRQIHFRDGRGKRHDLFGIPQLPAPLHLGPALVRFSALTIAERWKLTEAMLCMAQTDRDDVADVSFGEWLDAHDQPESLVQKFYDAVVISGLNEETRRASAAYAIQIFQESLLANRAGYVVGMPTCSLGQLYARMESGSHIAIQLGTRVAEICFDRDRVGGVVLHGGQTLTANAYVIATNHHAVQKWVPAELASRDSRFANLDRFDSVPILGVHMWFDRPILRESHAALMRGPLQWVFRKDATGEAVHGVISAAREWVDRSKDEMLGEFERQVRETFVEAREAKLLRSVVVIEKRATFSPMPGIDRVRPPQAAGPKGGIGNLFLAGDYTRTGWPATMEGAVRSGYLAADAVVERLLPDREHRSFLAAELPIEFPARLLGYRR